MLVDTNQLKLKISSTTSESLEYTLHYIYGNIKDPEFERVTILTINNLLTNSKTLLVGLELVKALVPYCSYNVIAENAVHWSNNCMVHYSEDPNKELKLNALGMFYLACYIRCFFKFHHNVDVEEWIVKTLGIWITKHGSAV
jgi:hypothetical protein